MATKAFEKTSITLSTFSASLKALNADNRETRRQYQQLLNCAGEDFVKNGQTGKFLQLYRSARLIASHEQMQQYIEACANVKFENVGKKNLSCVKRNKKPATYTPDGWWYDHVVEKKDKPIVLKDIVKMVDTFENSLLKAAEEHRLVSGQEALVDSFIEYLNKYDFDAESHTAPELKVA